MEEDLRLISSFISDPLALSSRRNFKSDRLNSVKMAVEFQALAVGIIYFISENTLVSLIRDISRYGRSTTLFSSKCPQLCKNIFLVKSFYLVGGTWKKISCLLCVKCDKYAFWVTLRLLHRGPWGEVNLS